MNVFIRAWVSEIASGWSGEIAFGVGAKDLGVSRNADGRLELRLRLGALARRVFADAATHGDDPNNPRDPDRFEPVGSSGCRLRIVGV